MKFLTNAVALLAVAAPLTAQSTAATTATLPKATAAPTVLPFTPAEEARYMALGKRAVSFMLKGQPDSLIALMPPENVAEFGGVEGAKEKMTQIDERAGKVIKVLAEKMTRRNGRPQFWYEADFDFFRDEPLVLRFIFTEEGKLVGLGMGPKSQAMWDN